MESVGVRLVGMESVGMRLVGMESGNEASWDGVWE